MSTITTIIVRTTFEATHSWPECPFEDVKYLKNEHRHIFHVEVEISVNHQDRDIEFIRAKQDIKDFIRRHFEKQYLIGKSCEMIAQKIFDDCEYNCEYVSVFEDNENGARVRKEGELV